MTKMKNIPERLHSMIQQAGKREHISTQKLDPNIHSITHTIHKVETAKCLSKELINNMQAIRTMDIIWSGEGMK